MLKESYAIKDYKNIKMKIETATTHAITIKEEREISMLQEKTTLINRKIHNIEGIMTKIIRIEDS